MKQLELNTAEAIYNNARYFHYQLRESDFNSTKNIQDSHSAASGFLHSVVLGHPKAPYVLAIYFENGTGVMQSDYMHYVMLGVAAKFGDDRFLPTDVLDNSPAVTKAVDDFYNFMLEAQRKYPATILPQDVSEQVEEFRKIQLQEGRDFFEYFADAAHIDLNPDGVMLGNDLAQNELSGQDAGHQGSDNDCCCVIL